MSYSDKVIDHYNNPRNVGALPKDDATVGTGLVGAPECGDVMKLQVKVNPETGVIEPAPVWSERDGRTTIHLQFAPAESVFVIFLELRRRSYRGAVGRVHSR